MSNGTKGMLETLRAVLAVPGVSGSEENIASTIARMIKPYVDEIRSDALGNLIAVKKGSGGKRVMLSAHMDQIGFVVTDIDEEGFLSVSNVGGFGPEAFVGKIVSFNNGTRGAVYIRPKKDGAERAMYDVYVDLGVSSKAEAEAKVQVGDTACVAFQLTDMGDRVCAPTMDDRAACAVLIELLKAVSSDGAARDTIIAVFSSQEEVGLRGATTAAAAENPDVGIALDVTATGDTPDVRPKMSVKLGAGPTVKIMDRASITTPSVREGLIAAAKRAGVPYQREVLTFGGTDAGAIQRTRGGIPAGTVSLPCRYVHSPVEMVSLTDMVQAVKLIAEYLKA
ncbi:MAG: M20/M25/M40 family metallo-hydrolase [Oscillospiraceae bacterium]|nr:M20/M25/M40 family metallo-hydrolase [Oscillospiraceae bacterium]